MISAHDELQHAVESFSEAEAERALAVLLEHAPEVVVLSRGRQRRLETCAETLALLETRHVEVVREETGAAIDEYNRLVTEGRRVVALFHTTC